MRKVYLDNSKRVNVFDIPVLEDSEASPIIGESMEGPKIVLGNKGMDFLRKMPILAEIISLGTKDLNELAIATYAHELTHLLVNRHKGVVENFMIMK